MPRLFPKLPKNRPALSRIDYRIGTYSTIRERLLRDLNQEPSLLAWTHREPDDPGIALLEGASILGDILTFYQDLYANEAFLRTAQWRESVARLVQLLGYRLSPGQGGKATFAFEVSGDESLTIPAGFPVQFELKDGAAPAVFETLKSATAYPWLSRFFLHRPLQEGNLAPGARELRLVFESDEIELEEGDRLILGTHSEATGATAAGLSDPDQLLQPQLVVVEEVRELHGHTIVKIEGSLQRSSAVEELVGYKLDRTFRHFGHNAPPNEVTLDTKGEATGKVIEHYRNLTQDTKWAYLDPDLASTQLPLDSQVDDFSKGGLVVCSYRNATLDVLIDPEEFVDVQVSAQTSSGSNPGPGSNPSYGSNPGSGSNPSYGASYGSSYGSSSSSGSSASYSMTVGGSLGGDGYTYSGDSVGYFGLEEADVQAMLDQLEGFAAMAADSFGDIAGVARGNPHTVVRKVTGMEGDSLRWGSVTGASTLLTLAKNLHVSGESSLTDIRTVQVHEVVSPMFRVRVAPIDNPATSGDTLYFHGKAARAAQLKDRRVMLVPEGAASTIRTVNAVDADTSPLVAFPGLHRLTLSAVVDYAGFLQEPEEDADGIVLGNLVDADQGKTEDEAVLGSGDQRKTFQTFRLPKSPLTYHFSADATPPEVPELEVYVDGRKWQLVKSLFGQKADAEVYVVREDDEGRSYVQFGDGLRFGARLPSGVDNVVALYRTGVGAYGPKKSDTTVQAKDRLDGLDAVEMYGVASGGEEPEPANEARAAAPGKIQTLDRLVGLQDFESEALGMSGVALARAVWALHQGIPSIVVTVLMQRGREAEFESIQDKLEASNTERGADRHPVQVTPAAFKDVYLDAQYAITRGLRKAPIETAIEAALGVVDETVSNGAAASSGLFTLQNRRLGGDEYASRVTGVIQNVTGVTWARVVAFQTVTTTAGAEPALPSPSRRDVAVACDDAEVLRLRKRVSASLLRLTNVVPETTAGAGDE